MPENSPEKAFDAPKPEPTGLRIDLDGTMSLVDWPAKGYGRGLFLQIPGLGDSRRYRVQLIVTEPRGPQSRVVMVFAEVPQ